MVISVIVLARFAAAAAQWIEVDSSVVLVLAGCELSKLDDPRRALYSNVEAALVAAVTVHLAAMLVVLVLEKLGVRVPAVLASSSRRARLQGDKA